MTIREKLSLGFTILTGSILLSAFLFLYFFQKRSGERLFDDRLSKRASTFVNLLFEQGITRETLRELESRRATRFKSEKTVILDAKGSVFFSTSDTLWFPPNEQLMAAAGSDEEISLVVEDYRIVGKRIQSNGKLFYLFIGAIDADQSAFLGQLRFMLVGIFLGMLVVVSLISWWIAGQVLQPFRNVLRQLDRISAASIRDRLPPYPHPDELGRLVSILNGLLDRIDQAFQLQKTFVANVSHELKNPLTKITSQIEVTLLNDRDVEVYRSILQSILEDVRDMNLLSKSLLDLTTISADPGSYSVTPVRMDELIWEVRDRVQAMPQGYQVSFTMVRVPEDDAHLMVSGNLQLLRTAFHNLIENAGKYSFDRRVEVTMHASGSQIEIHIMNQGPGIKEEHFPHLLDFGFRGDSAGSVSGYGIGLPLANRIIKIHSGKLSIHSEIGKNTIVRILFQKQVTPA